MRRTCCHTFLSSILKFINFLQFFVGFCMIVYSFFMLYHWHHHKDSSISDVIEADEFISYLVNGVQFKLQSLPAPWFIYVFMGTGILLCCITCTGHIAAEAINGCCLCFYAVLTTIFILLEASLVAFIAIDRSWEKAYGFLSFITVELQVVLSIENANYFLMISKMYFHTWKNLPLEPTGELDNLRIFVEENMDICKWVGIVVITLQVLSLLLAIILRALVSSEKVDATDEEYGGSGRPREPLLNAESRQTSTGDSKVTYPDVWNSRLREKYGLNNNETTKDLLTSTSSMNSRKSSAG